MNALGLLTTFGQTRKQTGPPPTAERIYQSPSVASPSPNTDASQIGYTITPTKNLTLTALRLYLGADSVGEVLRVWRVSDTTLLGSVTVNAIKDAWVEGALSTPINLDSGVAYALSAHSGNFRTWYSVARAAQTWSSLVTPGAGRLTAGTGFPGTTNMSNVWGIMDGLIAER